MSEPQNSRDSNSRKGWFHFRKPAEHPEKIALFIARLSKLEWQGEARMASLQTLNSEVLAIAYAEVEYYYSRRVSARNTSQNLRFLAWLTATFGIMIPLAAPVLASSLYTTEASLLQYGFIAFAITGAVLVADNLFAGTQAFIRNTNTQLGIERLIMLHVIDFQTRLNKFATEGTQQSLSEAVEAVFTFADNFLSLMATETNNWQQDVRSGINELKQQVSNAPGAKKP